MWGEIPPKAAILSNFQVCAAPMFQPPTPIIQVQNLAGENEPVIDVLYCTTSNFTFVGYYCRHTVRKTRFISILYFGNPLPTPSPLEGQIWHVRVDPQCTITCKISSESVYSVALEGREPQIFTAFATSSFFAGAIYRRRDKFDSGCTIQTFPISGIKIVNEFRLCVAFTNFVTTEPLELIPKF